MPHNSRKKEAKRLRQIEKENAQRLKKQSAEKMPKTANSPLLKLGQTAGTPGTGTTDQSITPQSATVTAASSTAQTPLLGASLAPPQTPGRIEIQTGLMQAGDNPEDVLQMTLGNLNKAFEITENVLKEPLQSSENIVTPQTKTDHREKLKNVQHMFAGAENTVVIDEEGTIQDPKTDLTAAATQASDQETLAEESANQEKVGLSSETGFPDPKDVLADKQLAVALATSRTFEFVRVLDYRTFRASGPIVFNTSMNSERFSAYDQFLGIVGGIYYSLLPDPGYDPATFETLHVIYVVTNNPDVEFTSRYSEKCQKGATALAETDLDVPVERLASLVMKKDVLHSPDYLNVMDISECATVLEEVRTKYPTYYNVYKMTYQMVHGGQACVDPIPEPLVYDKGMEEYLDAVCAGYNALPVTAINVRPRLARLKVVAPSSGSIPIASGGTPQVPKATEPPKTTGPKSNTAIRGQNQGKSQQSLLNQGTPGRVAIIRNTSDFRGSVESDSVVEEKLNLILDSMVYMNETMASLQASVAQMQEQLVRQDRALATYIAQSNQADLALRNNQNQALFGGTSATATSIIQQAPVKTAPGVEQIDMLIKRLQTFKADGSDPTLREDLVKLLLDIGDKTGSQTITAAAISLPPGRARIIERLKTYRGKVRKI